MNIETQETKELTSKNIDIYALWVKLGSYAEVARQLNKTPAAIKYHCDIIQAKQEGTSLIETARNAIIDNALPKAVAVYDRAMDDYDNKPDLAVNVATNVLKGTQVLIPKTMEDKTTKRLELIVKAEATANKLELVDLLGLDVDNIEATDYEIVSDSELSLSPKDPPPGGSDTTLPYSNDS